MKKSILSSGYVLGKAEQKQIYGGLDDDGKLREGNLCHRSGSPHLRCGPGLYCAGAGHIGVGSCRVEDDGIM